MTEALYIDTEAKMNRFETEMIGKTMVSVDFEFDRNRYRFGFNMCLIQLMADQQAYLIDPLSDIDLQPFFRLMEDPTIIKLVFSFGEDHRLLNKYGCFPHQVIDLKVLSILLNFEGMSLARLLNETIGIELAKTSQKSNWFKRPLSMQQISYAIDDVLYLQSLYNHLCQHDRYNAISEWMDAEIKLLSDQDYSTIDFDKPYKEKEKKKFSAFQWFLYEKILLWRNDKAAARNMPSFKILDKKEVESYCRTIIGDGSDQVPEFRSIKASLRNELRQKIADWFSLAVEHDLSRDRTPFEYPFSRQEQRKRKNEFYDLKKKYEPVKKQMADQIGNHTADYFLNNRFLEQLAMLEPMDIAPYKKELIAHFYTLTYDKDSKES